VSLADDLPLYSSLTGTCFTRAFGSSAYVRLFISKRFNTEAGIQAPAQAYLVAKYNISFEVAILGLSLYVLGFAMGPLICTYFTPRIKTTMMDHLEFYRG
jgi:hypothetical protein